MGNTFGDFGPGMTLDPAKPKEAINALREAVRRYKTQRYDWYLGQMRRRSATVNGLPGATAVLGVVGLVCTSTAVVLRTLSVAQVVNLPQGDLVMTGVALIAYTLMSAALLYDRLTEGSGGYFRAAATVVAIRDLWTAYQFADIARSLAPALSDAGEEIERWKAPAEDFCKALDEIVANEMTAWRTAYEAAAKLRSDSADDGLKAALTEMKASAEAAATAARDAAAKAEEAAKAEASARAPATLNLSLGAGATLGSTIVKLDGVEIGTPNQRSFSLTKLQQGEHHIRVEFTPSAAGSAMIPCETAFDLKGGINTETMAIP